MEFSGNQCKDAGDIKKSLQIKQDLSGVYVIAVVSHVNDSVNKLLEVSASIGRPLTYKSYDLVRDVFHLRGVDYHSIGFIPVNYQISLPETPWQMDIPLPFSVIRRYMADNQKQWFDEWKSQYTGSDYEIEFIQMLNAF